MDDLLKKILSAYARARIITYFNCAQATFGTMAGYLGITDRTAIKASCPLEGGGASEGSTCGVVSGGCLSITLAHLADILSGSAGKGEDLYKRLKEYTDWFESDFESTLCRNRCGVDVKEFSGFMDYIFTGKVVTRCVNHIGIAVYKLIDLINRPLEGGGEVTAMDIRLAESGGYCAADVLRGIRTDMGCGNLFMERLSMALDGGIGLSGGMCGALAGALLPMGMIWGIDPRKEGLIGTLVPFVKGHINLYFERSEPELWAVANPFVREFAKKYGSMECRDIVGRSFESGVELAEHIDASSRCADIKDWCRVRASELISANTIF
jgi:hypothetical protein